jgi:ketosteroid isomerase-like protein
MHSYIRSLFERSLFILLGMCSAALADQTADQPAIEAAAQAWAKAYDARDTDALMALATDDVVLLDPSLPPASGRKAAGEAWARALSNATRQVTAATKEIVIVGDVAWRIGVFTDKLSNHDVAGRGQSLEIWKRVNGQWKLHRQMTSGLLSQAIQFGPPPSGPILDAPRN